MLGFVIINNEMLTLIPLHCKKLPRQYWYKKKELPFIPTILKLSYHNYINRQIEKKTKKK